MLSSSSISFLKRLLDAPAPSGFETAAARAWRAEAETFAEKVSVDVAGNSMAEVNAGGRVPIDESPDCYKPAEEVLRAVTDAGLAEVEVRLSPIASIKGVD